MNWCFMSNKCGKSDDNMNIAFFVYMVKRELVVMGFLVFTLNNQEGNKYYKIG